MAQDMETWAKISAKLYLNDKIQMLADENPRAAWLWLNAITYCVDRRTDGEFTMFAAIRHLNARDEDLNALADAGLIEPTIIDGKAGWRIHDFLKSQRSSEEIDELSAKRRESGRRGAEKRWGGKPRNDADEWQTDGNCHSKPIANAMAKGWQTDGKADGKPIADTDTDTDTDTEITTSCCCLPESTNNARAEKEENNNNDDDEVPTQTPIPRDWQPDGEDAAYAIRYRLDPDRTGRAFRDYHLRHGTLSADWHAMFRGWCQRNPDGKPPPDER